MSWRVLAAFMLPFIGLFNLLIRRRSHRFLTPERREPIARKEFRRDPEDRTYVKEKAFRDVVEPRMRMTKRIQMVKRGVPYEVDSANIAALRQTVRNIINDMIADGIIKSKDGFTWFGLDNGQFVVDGNHLADSLRVKYAAKYVRDGNGYYCGSVSVRGHGYFFDKEEIYGDKKQ